MNRHGCGGNSKNAWGCIPCGTWLIPNTDFLIFYTLLLWRRKETGDKASVGMVFTCFARMNKRGKRKTWKLCQYIPALRTLLSVCHTFFNMHGSGSTCANSWAGETEIKWSVAVIIIFFQNLFININMQYISTIVSLEAPCAKTWWRALLFRAIFGITGRL